MKTNNKTELENIARSHSANIDYKDFAKIYKESFSFFFTIDTTLPASDPLIYWKNLLIPYKTDSDWLN